jgi:hypothetical protein
MKLKRTPIAKIKTGIWVNSSKLAKALSEISLFYGIVFVVFTFLSFSYGLTKFAIMNLVASIPLWIIQYSKYKFLKQEEAEEVKE